jgi:hypothetical protein
VARQARPPARQAESDDAQVADRAQTEDDDEQEVHEKWDAVERLAGAIEGRHAFLDGAERKHDGDRHRHDMDPARPSRSGPDRH